MGGSGFVRCVISWLAAMKPSAMDVHHVQYAVKELVKLSLGVAPEQNYTSAMQWPGAVLRIAMRRHDVNNGVTPPNYELNKPDVLLAQFYEHPVAKEYGFGGETTDRGAEGGS